MDRAQTRAHVDFSSVDFVAADCDRLFAGSPAPFRSQHTFTGAEKHPRKSRPRSNHEKNAGALGTRIGNCSRRQSARTARRLAKNLRALAAAPGGRQNQGLLHSRGALSFTKLDASKSTTIEHDQFPGSTRDTGANLDAEGFSRDSFGPAFTLLDDLQHLTNQNAPLPNWRTNCPNHRAGGS